MNDVNSIMIEAIKKIILNTSSDMKIKHLAQKHDVKAHFIPYRYRIFGGLLQSMNIQFGNFLESIIRQIIELENKYEVILEVSGKKQNQFLISQKTENIIDSYISKCQTENYSEQKLSQEFYHLTDEIKFQANEENNLKIFKHDVDLMFKEKDTNKCYYVEMKYNDDHDTGKFNDINRKFIKTYAYLVREFKNFEVKPILFYFTNKRMKGNIYLPERDVIFRGQRFFDVFTDVKYSEIDTYMTNISEDEATVKLFDDLYNKIVKQSKQ